jgi:hypothetical protein
MSDPTQSLHPNFVDSSSVHKQKWCVSGKTLLIAVFNYYILKNRNRWLMVAVCPLSFVKAEADVNLFRITSCA